VVVDRGEAFGIAVPWDELVNDNDVIGRLSELIQKGRPDSALKEAIRSPLAPLVSQEIWAAGVTYYRSRVARMEESEIAGGGNFYDRVYDAQRPELFLKATPHRVVGPGQAMHLRRDSEWMVPEPELTLAITRDGKIIGCTIGNDLSCRDLEGENPLYLPQAKTFRGCAAVGPALLVTSDLPGKDTAIHLTITRGDATVVSEGTTLASLKRTPAELVDFLFREDTHPQGCLLMTGTGIVPPDDFSLQAGDIVTISIDGIGQLENTME
jgi:2-dehydro-3-deoxy-D-arabinonate dehydratase